MVTLKATNVEKSAFDFVLMDYVGQAVIMVDANGKICFWNSAAEKLYGWTKEEVFGRYVTDVLIEDSTREEIATILKRLMVGESWSTEIIAKRKDESEFAAIVNRNPVFDDEGVYVGSTIIVTNITEEKTTERDLRIALEYLSDSLNKIEELNAKLKVVSSLTRHDVRNKLSTVTGYSYILKKKHYDLADVVEGLDKMSQAVTESMKIFDFAKTYEQLGVEELTYVDAGKVVDEAAEMFTDLPFKVVNACYGLTVRADSLLRQLIYNFIDNTRKYGIVTTTAKVHHKKNASGDLQLIYEDDGVGIPKEHKEQLFKQGFSTGGSTGFGLFLSKKMVEVYGWTITEEGKPGEGAKFIMRIPRIGQNGKESFYITASGGT